MSLLTNVAGKPRGEVRTGSSFDGPDHPLLKRLPAQTQFGDFDNPLLKRLPMQQQFGQLDSTDNPLLKRLPMQQFGGPQKPAFEARHADALKVLTFAGSRFTPAPHLHIEHEFITTLTDSQNVEEKAATAEILGRAKSINALPQLIKLLDAKEDVEVRTAAVRALARIGCATDKNSFTRTQITDTLMNAYQARKAEMGKRLMQPPGSSFDAKVKEAEERQALLGEIKALAIAISELNVTQGRALLQEDYKKSLAIAEQTTAMSQDMIRAVQMAEEELGRRLQKQYKKPVDEILPQMPPAELNRLRKDVKLSVDGQEIDLNQALGAVFLLKGQQLFASELLLGIMEGLSRHQDSEVNASLKLGLSSSHPVVKAKSLRILAERNGVSYNADVYPNLNAADPMVRQAAIEALLASPEQAARQKALELVMPKAFFDVAGGKLSLDSLGQYTDFLGKIADRGDEYVQALSKRALNSDYDIETRQIAMLVLGMMTEEPAVRNVSPSTVKQVQATIRAIANDPPARTPKERDALIITATQAWVEQKDPQAIANAIVLANSRQIRLTSKDRENLLNAVVGVLQQEADRTGETKQLRLKYRILNVMMDANNPLLSEQVHGELTKGLKKDPVEAMVAPDKPSMFASKNRNARIDSGLIESLQGVNDQLRPFLTKLLENDESIKTQMLASRIIGLLRDKMMADYLVNKVRDPLKGQIDWDSDKSYDGNPSIDGANIRLNALMALGQMGDAKGLDVMLDALDDPTLREYVLEPLGQIAKDVSAKADDATLDRARKRIVKVMQSPDTSRAFRATRIAAANTLFEYKGGVDAIKAYANGTSDPNFKRQALSALLSHDYATDPSHPDYNLVKYMIYPGLGVERLHAAGVTGKGVEMAIVDGGYVDKTNTEGFQDRVKLPANAGSPEHYHPTMVMSTAAGNGKLKGVAPDAVAYSDKWPDFDGADPMEVYKKIIEGKIRGENNVRVINNSWGFSNQNVLVFKEIRDILKQFKQVVDLAEKAGIQIVFAAGNDGENPGIPKIGTLSLFGLDVDKLTADEKKDLNYILDKVILVGAANTEGNEDQKNHKIADFSSIGDPLNNKLVPTVVAPGVDMMCYGWNENGGNPKELVNGTSFASPYVSGLIALMVQKNPKLTPANIREILTKTAVKLPDVPETLQGAGEVNPEAAVKMAQNFGRKPRVRKTDETQAPPKVEEPKAAKPDETKPADQPAAETKPEAPDKEDKPAA